jgi:hypothetical protein
MSERRGVLYLVWGEGVKDALERSCASVRQIHPELPIHIERLPDGSNLLDKAGMGERSPFEETLYLDADTVVLGRLDYAFERAAQFGLACSICECPWARRYAGLRGDLVEYNTGVVFFTRKAQPLLREWKQRVRRVDSSILFVRDGQLCRMPLNDQAAFAQAVAETGFSPFVLPQNWNFRPAWHKSWFGPIKIWHDYRPVPEELRSWSAEQSREESIIQYAELR